MDKIIIITILVFSNITFISAQNRYGHVNVQEIIESMPQYQKAKSDIDSLQNQYETDLRMMQEELYKKYAAFEKEEDTLPDNIKQQRLTEFDEINKKIQQSYQDSQQILQKAATEKMQVITAKVLDAIKAIGQEGGFVYILETNIHDVAPYISTTLSTDITAQVKTKLGLK